MTMRRLLWGNLMRLGVCRMKTPATLLVVLGLSLTLLVDPASAQLVTAERNALRITASPVAGATAFGANLSFRLNDAWDFLLTSDSVSVTGGSASLFGAGARYHFASSTLGLDPYIVASYLSASVTIPGFGTAAGSGSLIGGGASLSLAPNFTGFGTVGLVSGAGGSTLGYDVGIQYRTSQQLSVIIGASNVFSSGAVYFGIGIGLPGR
jgi:hypothetical protein